MAVTPTTPLNILSNDGSTVIATLDRSQYFGTHHILYGNKIYPALLLEGRFVIGGDAKWTYPGPERLFGFAFVPNADVAAEGELVRLSLEIYENLYVVLGPRSVNKVTEGDATLLDLTGDTIVPYNLDEGVTAHNAFGEPIMGTKKPSTATVTLMAGGAVQSRTDYLHGTIVEIDVSYYAPSYANISVTTEDDISMNYMYSRYSGSTWMPPIGAVSSVKAIKLVVPNRNVIVSLYS